MAVDFNWFYCYLIFILYPHNGNFKFKSSTRTLVVLDYIDISCLNVCEKRYTLFPIPYNHKSQYKKNAHNFRKKRGVFSI